MHDVGEFGLVGYYDLKVRFLERPHQGIHLAIECDHGWARIHNVPAFIANYRRSLLLPAIASWAWSRFSLRCGSNHVRNLAAL